MPAACWAHARRKLFDEFEQTKSPIAEETLRRIGKLYNIESGITNFDAELRQKTRKEFAVPILDELKTWFYEQRRRLSSKSNVAKALQYALTRWDALALDATDGRISIDNNIARKNFLFLGSDAGGDRAAVLYTILESAKFNGLNPEAYLADVIDRLAKGHPINRLSELLPWNWRRQEAELAAQANVVMG